MLYENIDDIPRNWDAWPIKYFTPPEIACRGTGELFVNLDALTKLDQLRSMLGKSVRINSAYRSHYHNCRIGGAPFSAHSMRGGASAFDIALGKHDKNVLIELANHVGFTGFGVNYNSFLHVDCGRRRSW
tara:strand:+ start:961 stop:1350 length:390 start_codon:yes stop_codon:yes gene_type:complete